MLLVYKDCVRHETATCDQTAQDLLEPRTAQTNHIDPRRNRQFRPAAKAQASDSEEHH